MSDTVTEAVYVSRLKGALVPCSKEKYVKTGGRMAGRHQGVSKRQGGRGRGRREGGGQDVIKAVKATMDHSGVSAKSALS